MFIVSGEICVVVYLELAKCLIVRNRVKWVEIIKHLYLLFVVQPCMLETYRVVYNSRNVVFLFVLISIVLFVDQIFWLKCFIRWEPSGIIVEDQKSKLKPAYKIKKRLLHEENGHWLMRRLNR